MTASQQHAETSKALLHLNNKAEPEKVSICLFRAQCVLMNQAEAAAQQSIQVNRSKQQTQLLWPVHQQLLQFHMNR